MRPCHIVDIETPKKIRLNGILFGPTRPRTVIVWVHGLGSSAFSRAELIDVLVSGDTSVLAFNNRGHDGVARVTRGGAKKSKAILAGAAHEVFTDCVDDIDGALATAQSLGAAHIFLAGHSTGCQKAVYWAHKRKWKPIISGIILLAPLSDYAGAVKIYGKKALSKTTHIAHAMVKARRGSELIPRSAWSAEPDDAQRFLSLYTPDSIEQSIFSYFDDNRRSSMLRSVQVPILTLLAEKDEYADRTASRIARWFEHEVRSAHRLAIIPEASHGFSENVPQAAQTILQWLQERQ